MILCGNPHAGYLARRAEIDAAVLRVLNKGWYILGQEVASLESEFAAWVGADYGIGVGSGTEALHLALTAVGVGPRDEVITVSHTAVATVAAIEMLGARPVLVDIEPDYFTMDPVKLAAVINSRTKAIVPVHLYGQPADMDPIVDIARERGIVVVEDCAQSHGAEYRGRRTGSIGLIGCFSFYPTKNLGALGDGGMVVTSDAALAGKIRALREYGWTERYVSHLAGWNSRLDELQAAIVRAKLAHLDADNASRQRLAATYDMELPRSELKLPPRRSGCSHVFHLYVGRSHRRDALQAHLKDREIGALVHYPIPVHLQPAYLGRLAKPGSLPETERAAREVLSLPLYPELTGAQQSAVIEAVREFTGLKS
ncbi:MAG: DegT/DnrJ/EryC1/StrS family aminotransferase [Methylocystis sp.]|nr:DegT/DnrJ/EryC1/StrS family aminotransferase [Methylocystis sp.]